MQRSLAVAVFSLGLPVVAWMAWRWSPFPRAPHPQVRSIEPRLTGITSYAPCEPQSDPERVISRIRCAGFPELGALEPREVEPADDERDEKETSRGLSAVDLRRNALAALSDPRGLGSIEMAVRSLEGATRADPGNAGNWSNLSAARFVLAQQLDDPSELIRALEAAQKAWQLDPALPESRFNRALILTMIPLRDQAITSWNDYLEIDDSSGWADEAREHLAALREPPTPELWSAQVPAALRAAALGNHAAQVRQIVDLSHQDARVHAQEDLLGDWGERVLAGQPAEEPLTVARAIGQVLAAAGDSSVALAVHFIDEQAGVPGVLATLARGHRAYREASRDLRNLFVERSIPGWSEALESFTAARSPMALWAEMGEAGVAIHQARGEEAWPRLQSIASQAHETGQIALEGRADWSLGLIRVRQGRYSESLSRYREAAGLFERIGELENLGAVRELIAENLTFLGQTAAGWQERYQAISLLFRYPSSIRLHNALWEGRTAALLDGELEAALLLQTEDLGVAERSGDPGMVAEALLRRSEIHLALGNTAQALQDLDDARRSNDRFEDREVREKLAADIVSAEGKLQSLGNPDQARASFSEALTYYEDKHLALQLIEAYLGRARACFALGEDEAGEADLQAALQVFEEQRSSVTDDGSRLSFSEAVQGLFDEMISLQARHGRSEAALAFSDRARTVPLARRAAHAELLADLLKKIPANLVLVEYAVMRDRLMIWVVRRGHIGLTSRTLQPGDLERRVGRFLSALRRGDGIAKIQEASAALHDILIPEELRGLPESVELCFVPDKILNAVPFAALWDRGQGRYLIETHPVATTPSIALSLEASARDRSGAGDAPPSALLVGATVYDQRLFSGLRRLPGAEAEIQGIRPLYPDAVVITGEEATRARVLDALGDREILHFSGHGVYNPRNPDHSYLVVASAQEPPDSGMLFAREIAGRNLERLRLVVLSACDTLGPRDSRTGGLSGIARPFLDAGVPAVLGTLWSAKDRASAALMPEFHRQFVRTGNVSLALREAQLEMLWGGEDELRSPAYWGAFEVVGGAL